MYLQYVSKAIESEIKMKLNELAELAKLREREIQHENQRLKDEEAERDKKEREFPTQWKRAWRATVVEFVFQMASNLKRKCNSYDFIVSGGTPADGCHRTATKDELVRFINEILTEEGITFLQAKLSKESSSALVSEEVSIWWKENFPE